MTNYHVCYNCKNRTFDCHAKCEPYLQEVKENNEMKRKNMLNNPRVKTKVTERQKRPAKIFNNKNHKK